MTLQKTPERLDEQLSEPKALDFDLATLNAEARIFVQQRTSEIKTLMRHAVSSVSDIRQKLLKVTASQIRKNGIVKLRGGDRDEHALRYFKRFVLLLAHVLSSAISNGDHQLRRLAVFHVSTQLPGCPKAAAIPGY